MLGNWPFDGTNIQPLMSRYQIEEFQKLGVIYWRIQYRNSSGEVKRWYVQVQVSVSRLPCWVDQLKPHLGLKKLGTHWLPHASRYRILYRVNFELGDKISKDVIHPDLPLEHPEAAPEPVSRIILFRALIGIRGNTPDRIYQRDGHPLMGPIKSGSIQPQLLSQNYFPDRVYRGWVVEHYREFGDAIRSMFSARKGDSFGSIRLWAYSFFRDSIKRVCPEKVLLVPLILQRLEVLWHDYGHL